MSVFSWIGQRLGLRDGRFWSMYYGAETWTGESVSTEVAMQVSAFWSCVRLIAETIGTLPLQVYERLPDGTRRARPDLRLYSILHDAPNADHTAVEFWEGVVTNLCLDGNFFGEKGYAGPGSARELAAVTALYPQRMSLTRDSAGELKFRYLDKDGKSRDIPEGDIFHVRGFGDGGDLGLSPMAYARQSLGLARAADRVAGSTFANGMRGSGWLIAKQPLSQDMRDLAQTQLADRMTGAGNAGKVGILEGDFFDYRQMSIPPEDAQLLESRRFTVEDVCRWLRVPPVLIGHSAPGQTMFGAGVEQIILGWYTLGLRPYLSRIEKAITRSLIPAEQRSTIYAEFNLEGLLRADSAARGEFYWKLFQMGAINRDWIADKENAPRPPGGDRYYVNQTLAPVDDRGVPIAPVASDAGDAPPPRANQRPQLEVVR